MSHQEFALARQLIAEERVGKAARAVVAEEDAAFADASKKLQLVK